MSKMTDLPQRLLSVDAVNEGPCVLEALISFDDKKYHHLCGVSVPSEMPTVLVFSTQAVFESSLDVLMMHDTSIVGYHIFIHQKLRTCAVRKTRR